VPLAERHKLPQTGSATQQEDECHSAIGTYFSQHFIQHHGCTPQPSAATVDTITIEFGPLPVHQPATVAELCELVKETRSAKQGLYPIGGRTTLDFGLPPTKPGVACDTTALSSVIDYPARDMTITVQAGITIASLQAELAKEDQWLPIDVASPEKATLGGAVAVNASGPRRYGYGTLRDYVIGISFVTDDGVEVKAGGRVVKNVAGYDLMKLQIGALGTFGVITQLTLKVKPKPEASAALVFGCDTDSLSQILDSLAASQSRPAAVELLNRAAWRAGNFRPTSETDWIVAIGFEEKSAAVRWQRATLFDELKGQIPGDVAEVADPAAFWSAITECQLRPESRFIRKLSVLPSQTAETVRMLAIETPGLIHAHALTGIIWLHDGERFPVEAVIRRCPTEAKKSLPVWGKPPAGWELMKHVKKTLDPDNVFNPGRMFAGE
jgi:glycolate oxidase FAD binding subunit